MASKTVIRHFADGTSKEFRRKKQGAPVKPDEMKRTETIIIRATKEEKERFMRMKFGMSQSAFGNLVLFHGLEAISNMQLSESNNCSTLAPDKGQAAVVKDNLGSAPCG